MTQFSVTTPSSHFNRSDVPEDVEEFLSQLSDCSYIDVPGLDASRTRVVTVLIHGSEPSGFIGMHRWLRTQLVPHVNLRFIIASVSAAQKPPIFSHRYLPQEQDLNRCFNQCDDPNLAHRAKLIVQMIKECNCEMVADIHNTSAPSSAFSISQYDSPEHLAISSFFCERMVLTNLGVGSLLEQDLGCPIVTIECGASDCAAHELAYQGIKALGRSDEFRQGYYHQPVQVMRNPLRVEIVKGVSLAYLEQNDHNFDLVIKADIECRNMDIVPKGYCIGWINGDISLLVIRDEFGVKISNEALKVENGCLIAKHNLQMFMATTNIDMAKGDCMFYIINLGDD